MSLSTKDVTEAVCKTTGTSLSIDSGAQQCDNEQSEAMRQLRADLLHFQREDRQHSDRLFAACNASLDTQSADYERHVLLALGESHFDNVFLPSLPMHFDQFCIFLMHGLSQFCGECALRTKTRSALALQQADPLGDYCPHLVCSEWSTTLKLRAISKTFWSRFSESSVGQSLRLYAPRCAQCHYANAYHGASRKQHVESIALVRPIGLQRLTLGSSRQTLQQQCVCQLSCIEKHVLLRLCQLLDWDARQRVVRGQCRCRNRPRAPIALRGSSINT